MTAEKLFAISCPFQAYQSKLDWKKSSITATIAFIFCALINSHFIFTHSLISMNDSLNSVLIDIHNINNNLTLKDSIFDEINNKTSTKHDLFCSYIRWNGFYNNYWPYIDAFIYSFIPFTVLSIFNILIVRRMIKIKGERSKLMETRRSSFVYSQSGVFEESSNTRRFSRSSKKSCTLEIIEANNNILKKSSKSNSELNRIKSLKRQHVPKLFIINLFFCLVSTSVVILGIYYYNIKTSFIDLMSDNNSSIDCEIKYYYKQFDLLKVIAEFLQYLNHSLNFFLYCLSGKKFRNEAYRYFKSLKSSVSF